ncbi:MAG TPA: hypothetical protein VGM07_03650 [Stellaceae bacterium]
MRNPIFTAIDVKIPTRVLGPSQRMEIVLVPIRTPFRNIAKLNVSPVSRASAAIGSISIAKATKIVGRTQASCSTHRITDKDSGIFVLSFAACSMKRPDRERDDIFDGFRCNATTRNGSAGRRCVLA